MKGKTNRQKQLIVTPDMSVRVTQVQQTLSVDIMFVYRMPILLGLLAPIVLAQVHDLRDDRRGEQIYIDRERTMVRHKVHSGE